MKIHTLPVSPFMMNCYILACEETKEAVIIDAGDEPSKILNIIKEHGYQLQYIINTHAHGDHVSAVAAIQEETDVDFYLHQKDQVILDALSTFQSSYGIGDGKTPKVTEYIQKDRKYTFGKYEFTVIETPGHTPGGICLKVDNKLFSGDSLFRSSIGRTDLPGGNTGELLKSIKEKLMVLDEKIEVYPGHGPATTIGFEKNSNPFLQGF